MLFKKILSTSWHWNGNNLFLVDLSSRGGDHSYFYNAPLKPCDDTSVYD